MNRFSILIMFRQLSGHILGKSSSFVLLYIIIILCLCVILFLPSLLSRFELWLWFRPFLVIVYLLLLFLLYIYTGHNTQKYSDQPGRTFKFM